MNGEAMNVNAKQSPHVSKVWNLPNILTYGRIVAVPLVAALLLWNDRAEAISGLGVLTARWIALGIYVVAAITDFFDGYLARRWHQQSSLGRMLDPIADKVLVAIVLLVLCGDQILRGGHVWAAIIILAREVLVSGLREYLGQLSVSVPVTQIAKWKTAVQMVAIGLLIAGPAGDMMITGITVIGIAGLWIAAALTLYTGYDYFRAGIRHVVDKE
jgi:cardiolipin synthase (CMP-forming)